MLNWFLNFFKPRCLKCGTNENLKPLTPPYDLESTIIYLCDKCSDYEEIEKLNETK